MRVAMGMININEEYLEFAKQIGVTDLIARPQYRPEDGYYDYESLVQLRTRVEAAGLRVAALHDVPGEWNNRIRCGLPGRDSQIDNYQRTLINMGRAGIPILGYSFHAEKVWRTSRHTPGRGGAQFTSYDHSLMVNAPPVFSPELTDNDRWESYEYFITRVMPAAEAAGVKMALHPDDPPISPIAGAAYIFRSIEAFQQALDMAPSPSNGLLFCQGCYAEMLGPGVIDAIRHFGQQKKIFYVHFRNVVGSMPKFREAFIDEGDINMIDAMKVWYEVGFDGPMMPDHHPRMREDSDYGHRARAFAIGYMKALIDSASAVNACD